MLNTILVCVCDAICNCLYCLLFVNVTYAAYTVYYCWQPFSTCYWIILCLFYLNVLDLSICIVLACIFVYWVSILALFHTWPFLVTSFFINMLVCFVFHYPATCHSNICIIVLIWLVSSLVSAFLVDSMLALFSALLAIAILFCLVFVVCGLNCTIIGCLWLVVVLHTSFHVICWCNAWLQYRSNLCPAEFGFQAILLYPLVCLFFCLWIADPRGIALMCYVSPSHVCCFWLSAILSLSCILCILSGYGFGPPFLLLCHGSTVPILSLNHYSRPI